MSKLSSKKREAFLDYLRDGWSISASAGKIGVSRQAIYKLRANDSEFAGAWEDAYESGTDLYEDEAKRRAVEGTLKPVFYQGQAVGHIREFSDTLLIVALKARRPEKYRERFDVEIKDARARAEAAVVEMMRRANVSRPEAIELLKPHIPQISELVH